MMLAFYDATLEKLPTLGRIKFRPHNPGHYLNPSAHEKAGVRRLSKMVAWTGFEPVSRGFRVLCTTAVLPGHERIVRDFGQQRQEDS